jgi:hypothetical protein
MTRGSCPGRAASLASLRGRIGATRLRPALMTNGSGSRAAVVQSRVQPLAYAIDPSLPPEQQSPPAAQSGSADYPPAHRGARDRHPQRRGATWLPTPASPAACHARTGRRPELIDVVDQNRHGRVWPHPISVDSAARPSVDGLGLMNHVDQAHGESLSTTSVGTTARSSWPESAAPPCASG